MKIEDAVEAPDLTENALYPRRPLLSKFAEPSGSLSPQIPEYSSHLEKCSSLNKQQVPFPQLEILKRVVVD